MTTLTDQIMELVVEHETWANINDTHKMLSNRKTIRAILAAHEAKQAGEAVAWPWKKAYDWDKCPDCFEDFSMEPCNHCGSGYPPKAEKVQDFELPEPKLRTEAIEGADWHSDGRWYTADQMREAVAKYAELIKDAEYLIDRFSRCQEAEDYQMDIDHWKDSARGKA